MCSYPTLGSQWSQVRGLPALHGRPQSGSNKTSYQKIAKMTHNNNDNNDNTLLPLKLLILMSPFPIWLHTYTHPRCDDDDDEAS